MNMLKKSAIIASVLVLGIAGAAAAGQKDKSNNQVMAKETIVNGQQAASVPSLMEDRLNLLESGIIPVNPDETVNLWAKAVQMRNGALQYALFTDNVKAGTRKSFEEFHWVTGVSSPWVESFKVTKKENLPDKSIQYFVEFNMATSTGSAGKDYATVTVVEKDGQWLVNSIAPTKENTYGIWNTPKSIKEVN